MIKYRLPILFLIVFIFIANAFASPNQTDDKKSERFVIGIAKIGKGHNMQESRTGDEIKSLLVSQLTSKMNICNGTEIHTISLEKIVNHDDAEMVGKQYGIDLIVWGWISATSDIFVPEFKIIQQVKGTELIKLEEFQRKIYDAHSTRVAEILNERISALSMLLISLIHYSNKEYEKALVDLNNIKSLKKKYFDKKMVCLYTGNIYFRQGSYNEAIKEYDLVTTLDPGDSKAWYNKGVALDKIEKYTEAIACYDKAINNGYKDAWYKKGHLFDKLNRHQDAVECYNKVLEIDPDFALGWYEKGILLDKLGNYLETIACYDMAIKLEPSNRRYLEAKAIFFHQKKKYEEAVNCYDTIMKIYPDALDILVRKGTALYELGRYEESLPCYEMILKKDPGNAILWYCKGLVLMMLEKYTEAIKCYDLCITISPEYENAWIGRGIVFARNKMYNETIRCYNKALEINPQHAMAKELEKAIAEYETIITEVKK